MTAAFSGEEIGGRQIVLMSANDFYELEKAVEATQELINTGVFARLTTWAPHSCGHAPHSESERGAGGGLFHWGRVAALGR